MKIFIHRNAVASILMAVMLPLGTANAQLDDILKRGESTGSSSGSGNLGAAAGSALSGQSIAGSSTGNVAGVLDFCIKNNFLGGNDASSVKDKLMGKLGGAPANDTGYKDGAKGLLKGSDGKQLDLSGGGMKADMTKQVCSTVLSQGKSLL